MYVYAANNPSESILAKRRGYGTIVSYNVPPYGRSGLYLELANLKDLIEEYKEDQMISNTKQSSEASPEGSDGADDGLKAAIWSSVQKSGMMKDVPLYHKDSSDMDVAVESVDLPDAISTRAFNDWLANVSEYLVELQTRLFSSGLHVLGQSPTDVELLSYIEAYFGDDKFENPSQMIADWREQTRDHSMDEGDQLLSSFLKFIGSLFDSDEGDIEADKAEPSVAIKDAYELLDLLNSTTEEMDNVIRGLNGGYIPAAPGGDLLRYVVVFVHLHLLCMMMLHFLL